MSGRPFRHTGVLPRFRDAAIGLVLAYREEPNLRFHVFAAACVAVAGFSVRLAAWEGAYLAVTIALVLIAEVVNTAIERAVDLAADGQIHPLAAVAKEVSAGAVLVAALHAAFAAVYLFLIQRPLSESLSGILTQIARQPGVIAIPALAGLLGLFGGTKRRGSL